jgi:hypothetical protein
VRLGRARLGGGAWRRSGIVGQYLPITLLVLDSTDSGKEGGGGYLSSHQHRLRIRVGR